MQITTFPVQPRWLFVRIETDSGLVGWGECLGDKAHEKLDATFKPIESKPGMVMVVPTESWKRGLYSVDIKGMEYYFGIEVPDDEKFWREVLAENPQLWQAHNHLGAALFVLVRKATPDEVLAELRGAGGKILKTSLTHEKEQKLQAALDAVRAQS